ncbi:MAG: bifunctional DNA-formamidopyrimidine glycosylase/DNA-(apurinic or apyrimidinic site) lyase [Methylococcaceae bacterium]
MPELPEVETTCRGIRPHILNQTVEQIVVREHRLRWPVTGDWIAALPGAVVTQVWRRGKYILLDTTYGTLILHLGMSGSLRITTPEMPPRRHDHIDLVFAHGVCLRFHDPRRFGCLLWTETNPAQHPLLAELGPEPLAADFTGDYLAARADKRTQAIKTFIMDSHQVVGVGNIYANEALFRAGINPARPAGQLSGSDHERLSAAIRSVLAAAITMGGTTLRDFVNESGAPGYFSQTLMVYGRTGQACRVCGQAIQTTRLGQRATYWCAVCQKP